MEKSGAQIRLWVDLNHARAMHAPSEDQVCRILSRNMKVLQEMAPARVTGTAAQRLTLQTLHSVTAQVCCLSRALYPHAMLHAAVLCVCVCCVCACFGLVRAWRSSAWTRGARRIRSSSQLLCRRLFSKVCGLRPSHGTPWRSVVSSHVSAQRTTPFVPV